MLLWLDARLGKGFVIDGAVDAPVVSMLRDEDARCCLTGRRNNRGESDGAGAAAAAAAAAATAAAVALAAFAVAVVVVAEVAIGKVATGNVGTGCDVC